METKGKKLAGNVFSALFGQLSYIAIGFIGNVIIARLLGPSEIGRIGLLMVYISFSNILVESGFGGALIQKDRVSEKDYSTIFIFNLLISLLLSFLIYIFSDAIASFYEDKSLSLVLKILGIVPVLNAIQVTSNAKLVREMQFKKRAIYKFVSLLIANIVAIIIAIKYKNIWSVVCLNLLSSLILSVFHVVKIRTFNTLTFNKQSFKSMRSFGIYTSSSNLLNSVFNNIYQIILGKYFSFSTVGFFYQAKRLQDVSDTLFQIVFSNVFFSHLARLQNDRKKFEEEYLDIIKAVLIISSLFVSLVFIYSDEIIVTFYGYDWLNASFFLKVLSASSFFYLQEVLNKNIFKVFNKTKLIFYLEIVKKAIQTCTILVGIYYLNIELLLYGFLLTSVLSYFINIRISRKILGGIQTRELVYFFKIFLANSILIFLILYTFEVFQITIYRRLILIPFIFVVILTFYRLLKVNYKQILKNIAIK